MGWEGAGLKFGTVFLDIIVLWWVPISFSGGRQIMDGHSIQKIVHVLYFIKNVFYSVAFFNHFSNAIELEAGLGAILHAILHAGCIFLGLCLYYGSKEGHKECLLLFLVPVTIATGLSLIYLMIVSIFYTITILQIISWSTHIIFYSIVLLVVSSALNSIPSSVPPGPEESSLEDGMVQEVKETVRTTTFLFNHMEADFFGLIGWIGNKSSGLISPFSPKERNNTKEQANKTGVESDSSDSD